MHLQGRGKFCTGIFPQGKIPHGENSTPVPKNQGENSAPVPKNQGENSAPVPKNQGENSAPPKSSVHWKQKGSWDCDPQKTHTTTGTQVHLIVGLPNRSHVLNASDQFSKCLNGSQITDPGRRHCAIVPQITCVDGVARHSQIIRLRAPPSLLVDKTCRRVGTKQMGARGEAQGIRWYGGLHGQNSARGKFRTSPRKMRGKFRTKMKYGIFPAEKSPRGISPALYAERAWENFSSAERPRKPFPHKLRNGWGGMG